MPDTFPVVVGRYHIVGKKAGANEGIPFDVWKVVKSRLKWGVDPLPDYLLGRGSPTSDSLARRYPGPDSSSDTSKVTCNPVQTSAGSSYPITTLVQSQLFFLGRLK